MTMSKFFNQADPVESYRREILYGSKNRFWDDPWENFLRPYLHQTISKLTPGEYIPAHVEERREMDAYLDRMKLVKHAEGGEAGRARRTMLAADMYGDPNIISSALPSRERPFFESFLQETDPGSRKQILSMVSQDMQRALVGQWSQQYAKTQGGSLAQGGPSIQAASQVARMQIKRMGRNAPPADWAGSNPAIDWEDIKTVMIQNEGMDTHDFNIWDDRTNSLLRKPYVRGAVAGLTSRPMATNVNSMGRRVNGDMNQQMAINTTYAHRHGASFSINNDVNYAMWEEDQYQREIERLRG
jgi:hypothetical protein